jgi:hypothetical protein
MATIFLVGVGRVEQISLVAWPGFDPGSSSGVMQWCDPRPDLLLGTGDGSDATTHRTPRAR